MYRPEATVRPTVSRGQGGPPADGQARASRSRNHAMPGRLRGLQGWPLACHVHAPTTSGAVASRERCQPAWRRNHMSNHQLLCVGCLLGLVGCSDGGGSSQDSGPGDGGANNSCSCDVTVNGEKAIFTRCGEVKCLAGKSYVCTETGVRETGECSPRPDGSSAQPDGGSTQSDAATGCNPPCASFEHCDKTLNECVTCLEDAHCASAYDGPVCISAGTKNASCGCNTGAQCTGHPSGNLCNQYQHACSCAGHAECKNSSQGSRCIDVLPSVGLYQCGCDTLADCPTGTTACSTHRCL